jgi:membrane-associated phospholipid phosphatase
MEQILQWGLDVIRAVQTLASPPLTVVIKIITSLGGSLVFIAAIPFIYLCVNEKKGLHLTFIILISAWINISLKYFLDFPRPFFEAYDPSVGMIPERMGGMPSGHAQNSLVLFIFIASMIAEKHAKYARQIYITACVLCFLIGFSRIYLGVHFPTDIIAGWLIGGIILCGYFLLGKKIEALIVKGNASFRGGDSSKNAYRAGMIASAVTAFLMILYIPGVEALMPGSIILSMGVGYCLNRRFVGFKCSLGRDRAVIVKCLILLARFILGIAGFMLVFIVTERLFPSLFNPAESSNHKLYGFARLALGGFWISLGAPWVFIKLHLAEKNLAETSLSGTVKNTQSNEQ